MEMLDVSLVVSIRISTNGENNMEESSVMNIVLPKISFSEIVPSNITVSLDLVTIFNRITLE